MTTEEESLAGGRDVYWFVGGPLDGRVHTREPSQPAPYTVRSTHLHEGPKIVHHSDLHEVAGHGGEYRFRGPGDAVPDDDTSETSEDLRDGDFSNDADDGG